MRKRSLLAAFLIITISLVSCKSTDEAVKRVEAGEENTKKNYVGWVDASTKDVFMDKGLMHFAAKPNLGAYNISVVNEDGKIIPVFSTVDEFTSTTMYLRTAKKVYRLISDNNQRTSVSKTSDTMTLTYAIANVAEVVVDLQCLQSSPENDFDIVKTVVTITNKGTKKESFALKQIIDTILGEASSRHFFDSENQQIKNEVMYRNPKKENWFVSRNTSGAMQMFFAGADATVPELVALANYSTLSKSGWEPDMLSFRTFDTVLSYNNSAVGVVWPETKLMPKESSKVIYYMAFATDGKNPNGEKYVLGKVPVTDDEVVVLPKEIEQTDSSSVETSNFIPKDIPNVEFTVEAQSKEKYSPEYIQKLLDRIAVLEKNSASVNREELLRLNAELDEILSSLRQ